MKLVAIDFETANHSPLSACAIGFTIFEDGELLLSHWTYIKPVQEANYFYARNIEIHGISASDIADAPLWDEVFELLKEHLDDCIVIAHNVRFDVGIFLALCKRFGIRVPYFRYFDTIDLAKKLFKGLPNYKLNTVADHIGINLIHHDACSDARAAALIVINAMNLMGIYDLEEFIRESYVKIYET